MPHNWTYVEINSGWRVPPRYNIHDDEKNFIAMVDSINIAKLIVESVNAQK